MKNVVEYRELRAIVKALWFTPGYGGRWGLPLLLWGDPGIGKTSMLRALSTECGLPHKTLLGSTADPTDFGGIPTTPVDGSRFVRTLLPGWLEDVAGWPDGGGVVTFDELTCVPAAQQAAMLGTVLEGTAGDYRMHSRVRVVAAANPVEQAAGGQALALPMGNRFGHFHVAPVEIDDWLSILHGEVETGASVDPLALEAEVLDQWSRHYDTAVAQVGAFLRRRPTLRQQTPTPREVEDEGAWASLRSWELCMRALAGGRIHSLSPSALDCLLAAYVGHKTAVQFSAWLRDADLPDPLDVLDATGTLWALDPMRPDRTHAVLDACTSLVLRDQSDAKIPRARRLWCILEGFPADQQDLALDSALRLQRDEQLVALPEAVRARRAMAHLSRALQLGGLK